jgi:OPA family glycerol-3-phosphate transporter-like MFS transporter
VWVPPHFLGPDWRTRPGAAWITVALPLGMACGALAVGWLGDRLFRADHLRVAAPCLGLAALTAAGLAAVPVGAALPGLAGLFLAGFLVFGPVAAFTALGADVLDRRLVGTGLGVMNALGYAVAAAGDLVIGAAIDVTGWSGAVFPVTAVALAGGALCARAARR